MNPLDINDKQKELIKTEFWTPNSRNSKIILFILLIFGIILAIFCTNTFLTYANGHIFMKNLRGLFKIIFDTLQASKKFQTPENIAHLVNISIFNFYYTNILLLFSQKSIFSLIFNFIPNIGLIDMIVGYSLIFFSSLNLVFLKIDVSKLFSHSMDPQVLFATNSLIIPITLTGYLLENMFILGFCGLYWALICFYIMFIIPIGNKN